MSELLPKIDDPSDLRKLEEDQLPDLCREIRDFLLETVFATGGHLATNLGSVDLTVALHYVFDFLEDRLIFDVGHQAYTHKILTGRRDRFHTQRSAGGLSGFTNPKESPYDHFMGGHAGTSISAGLGVATGSARQRDPRKAVVVIGDASIGAGMAFEALNQAGDLNDDVLVVLNDNRMSISKTVGALSGYLTKLRTMPLYSEVKKDLQAAFGSLPLVGDTIRNAMDRAMETMKYYMVPGHIFEDLGIKYFGPYDGHDVHRMVKVLRDVKRHRGPAILHVLTEKGKGHTEAEADPIKYHGVSARKPREKVPAPTNGIGAQPAWTKVFSDALIDLAEDDPNVMAITAAMPGGTGTDRFQERFPERFLDVGICEQHGVGMAAGLSREGILPVVAIYSTFLQRAYDQVFHDVVLNGRPIVFCMDRAGIVGEDGWSHHGLYDIAYLRTLPGITLMAPKDGPELHAMLRYAARSGKMVAIRYPRGKTPPDFPREGIDKIEAGRAEVMTEGCDGAIWAYGSMLAPAVTAASLLAVKGIEVTVVNPRFCRPIDAMLLKSHAETQPFILTVEEGSLAGGFGSAVLETFEDVPVRVRRLGVPDELIDHSARAITFERLKLTPEGIASTVEQMLHEKTSHPTWR
jgi:1-deoxy-D-xylulose-5-phosphate synthase